jgi:hypothetical protein
LRSILLSLLFIVAECHAQPDPSAKKNVDPKRIVYLLGDSVTATFDIPAQQRKKWLFIIYALPNGNTTGQTAGKKMQPGDDWHFDIQHIAAQTKFIRRKMKDRTVFVVYLENGYKSWPLWKQKHPDYAQRIPRMVDNIVQFIESPKHRNREIYLNGHSGGGSFIFGYLAGVEKIPSRVKRISFLDSDYGYDSSYYPKLSRWIKEDNGALNVFAYNDSVVIYNGKPLVSPTGGTWYRSKLMLQHLSKDFDFVQSRNDSLIVYKDRSKRLQFYFKPNPEGKIYHTVQVELNGFIHSVLCGTKDDSKGYIYFGARAYASLIED